jgi:hypothetical protein
LKVKIEMKNPVHLGDGAYCSLDECGGIVLTANHHDPQQATDTVYLERRAIVELLNFLKEHNIVSKEHGNEDNICLLGDEI